MRRLYLQFYAALLIVLFILSLLTVVSVWSLNPDRRADRWLVELETFASAVIPPSDAPLADIERVVHAFAEPLKLDLGLYDVSGALIVSHGLPPALPETRGSQWREKSHNERILVLQITGGRHLVVSDERDHAGPIAHLLFVIALLALATAIAAYPVARRLTRRLENLRHHVSDFGAGDLSVRAPIEGRDEIADLARSFNASADQIEGLVSDKTRLLANTSHELRTPLTRVRMGLELLREGPRPELLDRMDRDIEELDDLIGELLIASRLDSPDPRLDVSSIDLLALVAEEIAGRDAIDVAGDPVQVNGDRRLLRRLVRNLIENALRHGMPPVEIRTARQANGESDPRVELVVEDRGPGIPEGEHERIFEPFYRPQGEASAEGGIGLGLALVRQIAERHQGSIRCEPREGGGTRFLLDLPAS